MLTNVSSELPSSTIVRLQQQMINAVLGGTHWLTVSEVRDISCADNAPVIGGYRKEEYLQSSEMVTRNFRVTHSTVAASLSQYCKRC